ncbi:hypothetical protein HMPREF9946_00118 [Acetobacteraceae bacterium AT-5844]|nr:hypothetical protein HMPREF9946_00118 [Acetobacteraceae bacterium AT-5844]
MRTGTLLSTPLEQLRDLSVIAHCGDMDCPPPPPIPVARVAASRRGARVADVAHTFHCAACGRLAEAVSLREDCADGGWILQPIATPGQSRMQWPWFPNRRGALAATLSM